MKANRVCSPLMRAALSSCTLAVALFLGSLHGTAQPGALPWFSVRSTDRGMFEHAIRVSGAWVAVGDNGRISTIRSGVITNIVSPLRESWRSVWAAQTGELFVADGGNPCVIGMRARDGTWQLWRRDGYGSATLDGLAGNAVWADSDFWDGTAWKAVSGMREADRRAGVFRVGTKTYLRNDSLTWQLNRDHATRAPTLDGFSELGGSGDWPEWGIRNGEIFRFVGNRWVHFAQAPKEAKIVTRGHETLFFNETEIARVQGKKLVFLGQTTKPSVQAVFVGVAIDDGGVLALTNTGQELRLNEGKTQVAFADQGRVAVVPHGAPNDARECTGSTSIERIGAVQKENEPNPRDAQWRTIFARGTQKYSMVSDGYRFLGIERFDGKGWSPWIDAEVTERWGNLPNSIGGEPQPDSELWFAGRGYIVDYAKGRFVRHTLPGKPCLNGFFRSSTDAYFYGSSEFPFAIGTILRRVGGGWVREPAPAVRINGMCEREGRVYAEGEVDLNPWRQEKRTLLLRRASGYFSSATSQGDWDSGLSEEEFGPFEGMAGSSEDGYLLVGDRIEHFDGKSWSEYFTDTGLGLKAIAQSQGWVLGLGKDGFLYQRDKAMKGARFLRQQHLNATSLVVESPTEATVANAKNIYHWNGQSWTEQKGPGHDKKGLQIVGFARLQGKLRAFESNGQVLSLDDGVWQRLSSSDPIAHIPGPIVEGREDSNAQSHTSLEAVSVDTLPHGTFEPCVAFQPRPEVVVLLSCNSNWEATFNSGNWTSAPLPYDIGNNRYRKELGIIPSSCLENGACYIFGHGSVVLRADRAAL
jgi:hypothetical protein